MNDLLRDVAAALEAADKHYREVLLLILKMTEERGDAKKTAQRRV